MVSMYMKKIPTSLNIRQTQIKTTMQYAYHTSETGTQHKEKNNQCWYDVGKKTPLFIAPRNAALINPLENFINSHQKCRNEHLYYPAILLLGIYFKGPKFLFIKVIYDNCSTIHNNPNLETNHVQEQRTG